MKIQIVYDIAPNSTRDVGDGLRDALRGLGHEVCGTPTHSYAVHLCSPFNEYDPGKIPKDASALLWGAVNKLILADTVLFEPDAVIVVSGWVMGRWIVDKMKQHKVLTALYLTESPYQDREQIEQPAFGGYDLVFCNELSSMDFMRQHHDRVVYLPHSYNPEVHHSHEAKETSFDAYMCGTGFSERLDVLRAVDWSGVGARLLLHGFWPQSEGIDGQVIDDQLPNRMLPEVYASVPINLNIHRTTRTWQGGADTEEHITHAQSVGPRVLEVLASGGFLMTDHRGELDEMGLRDGEHLVVFKDARHLQELVREYLPAADARRRIAEAGRAAVAGCTFGRRCDDIILPELQRGVTRHG